MRAKNINTITVITLLLGLSGITSGQYFTYVNPTSRTLDKTNAKVGSLPGTVNVNSLGAATYEIPIFTSPGSAGMQPSISIVYNSQFKDGILGIGWDIAGLSEIRRVPQNIYHENNVTGVTLQNTDKFALDSNRLILKSQHQYGADASEYATEIETFVKVIAHGIAGTGPSWFEVQTKDGRTLEYGNTTDSKVEAYGSTTVYMWRLNKVKDQSENTMNFIYNELNGESCISRIDYTINTPAGQPTPYNSLKFNYYTSPRTDSNIQYVAGSQLPSTKLLSSIRMETEGSALVREYQFKYHFDVYSHLNQIIEYGSDGTYLNSTVIGWGSTLTQFSSSDVFNNAKKNLYYTGDFNGDGRTDFVVTENKASFTTSDQWKMYLTSSDGTSFTLKNSGYLDGMFKGFFVSDIDGNGNDDIYWRKLEIIATECNPHPCTYTLSKMGDTITEENKEEDISLVLPPPPADTCWDICYTYNVKYLYYYNYGTTGLVRGSSSNDLVYNNAPLDLSLISADLDGNGKEDYIAMTSYKNIYNISGVTCSGYPSFNSPNDVRVLDFNGNGKKDLLVIKNSTSTIYEYNAQTTQFVTLYSSSTYPTTTDRLFLGDFNGDKKTDFLSWKSGYSWSLKMSSGTSLIPSTAPGLINTDPSSSVDNNNYYVGDFNGDQKDDILEMYLASPTSKMKVFFSRGGGLFYSELNTFPKSIIKQDYFRTVDMNGDGKKDMFYYDNTSTANYVNLSFFPKDEKKHLITCILNGLNYRTVLYYDKLNSALYTKGSDAHFPIIDYNGSYQVVSSILHSNGLGTITTTTNYSYEGLKIHKQGKGSLGFKKISTTDEDISFVTVKEFDYDPTFFFSYLIKTTVSKESGPQISEIQKSYSTKTYGNKRYFPYQSQEFSYDNLTDFYLVTAYYYDDDGNQIYSWRENRTGTSTDGYQKTHNTFETYGNYGVKNKLISSVDSSYINNEPVYISKAIYTYDNYGKLLTQSSGTLTEPMVTQTYSQFNGFGLAQQVTVSANGVTSRTTTFEYDTKKRFVTKTTNPLGQFASKTYAVGTGNVLTETSIDNNTTTFQYDGFGRLVSTTSPQNRIIESALGWDGSSGGGANSLYYKSVKPGTSTPGIPDQYVYYDLLGRELMTIKDGLTQPVYQKNEYNADGTLYRKSLPYYSGETPKWISYLYDEYGRTSSETNNGLTTSITYDLGFTTVTNPADQTKTTKVNAAGKVMQVTENNDNIINYSYHSSGQVRSISTAGTTVTMSFDNVGRQTSVTNPNSGTVSYIYNNFGELIEQRDAKDTLIIQYNLLGQPELMTSTDGPTSYSYVPSGYGVGQIQTITGPNGITQSYSYDSYGQVTQLTESIPGDQSLTTGFAYDLWGRNTTVTYPSGIVITNQYNSDGYLNEIKNSGVTLWKVNSVNSWGQPTNFSLGTQGLTKTFQYDPKGYVTKILTGIGDQSFLFDQYSGNLTIRSYKKTNNPFTLSESFTYDNMNRLYTSRVGSTPLLSYNYMANGNISDKSGVGGFSYDQSRVNAIAEITNNYGAIPTTTQDITYNSFNLTSTVAEQPDSIFFTYGPDNQRIKSVLFNNQAVVKTKYYSPGYEKEVKPSGTRQIHYINSPYGMAAILVKQGENVFTYFTETDYLGSIIGLMNPDGIYTEQYSFDPWGRRRNPTDWTFNNVPTPTLIDRGYTGHEHLDEFGLINMNGRMYDPVISRFLSVDPIIQSPENSQTLNGYSYCINNPMKYTDPSGLTYTATMDLWYGEGNYWYRGQAPGTWSDWESFHYGGGSAPVHNGNMTYHYNWGTGVYTDKSGRRVDYDEVNNNYVVPYSSYSGEVGAGFAVGDGMAFFMKDGALIYIPPSGRINWKSTLTAGPGGATIDESWGKMYVITNVGPDAGLMDGHAWIRIESNNGGVATMSLWGNRGEQEFWVNLELDAGYGIINKSTEITQSQFVRLIDFNLTSSNLNWTPWNSCAGYSSNLWNYVTGGNLSASDILGFTTPRRLAKYILGKP